MNKKVGIIGLIIFISIIFITLRVLGQDNHKEESLDINAEQSKSLYIFVKKWGSKGYSDGQFGGVGIAEGATFMITDKTIASLKNIIDDEKLKSLLPLKNREFVNINECYYTLEKLTFNGDDCWTVIYAAASEKVIKENIGSLFIAIDKFNNVYVSDIDKAQIQKFDSEGNFLTKWGRGGSGKGQFDYISGIAVDSECYVYALDRGNHRIQKFDSNGNFILKWGSYGAFDGQFASPTAITVSSDNCVYVNNNGINIQKFDSNGEFLKKWKFPWNSSTSSFRHPILGIVDRSIVIDSCNNLFILTYEHSDNPMLISNVLYPYISKCNLTKCSDTINGQKIFGEKDCIGIVDFTLDLEGNLFVLNSQFNCIYKISPEGNLLAKWGSSGSGDGEFNNPDSIAVDHDGNVYVMDTGNYRIQKFAPNPEFKADN